MPHTCIQILTFDRPVHSAPSGKGAWFGLYPTWLQAPQRALVLCGRWLLVCAALLAAGCSTTPSPMSADANQRHQLRLTLASAYFEQGQYEVALEEVQQALLANPNSVDALNLRGLALNRLNQLPGALQSFEQALARQPFDANTLHNRAWLRCEQAQYALADRDFELALQQVAYTQPAKTWTSRGLCQIRAQQWQAALLSLKQAEALRPAQAVVQYNLAWVFWRLGDLAQAQRYTRMLNNSAKANAESLWLGARVERALHNTDSMAQLLEQLKKRYPLSPQWNAYERGAFDD